VVDAPRSSGDAERGFSLVELSVATLILAVCFVGVALMVLYGTRLSAAARDATLTTGLARARLERLRVLPRSAAERQPGGSLVADVPGHYASDGRLVSRWRVSEGPAGTQDVSLITLAPADPRVPPARLRVLLR
jgi:prepilin-type N-terminal cleavage/methylation domain-containing protein